MLQLGRELGIGVSSAADAERKKAIANGEPPQARVGGKGKRQSALLDFAARAIKPEVA